MADEMVTTTVCVSLRRNRDLMLWWAGSTVSGLGTGISSIAMPLLVLGATGSAAKAAVVGVGSYAALIALSLPAGVVADRYSRRRILVLTPLVNALALGTVTLAVLAGHVWIVHLVLVGFVLAAMGALYGAANNPTLRRIVPREQIELALSRGMAISSTVGLVAPPVGGSVDGPASPARCWSVLLPRSARWRYAAVITPAPARPFVRVASGSFGCAGVRAALAELQG